MPCSRSLIFQTVRTHQCRAHIQTHLNHALAWPCVSDISMRGHVAACMQHSSNELSRYMATIVFKVVLDLNRVAFGAIEDIWNRGIQMMSPPPHPNLNCWCTWAPVENEVGIRSVRQYFNACGNGAHIARSAYRMHICTLSVQAYKRMSAIIATFAV